MKEESIENCKKHRKYNRNGNMCGGGAVYGMGLIGAIVYYFTTATTFWMFVFGFFKAIFWPAFLIYEVLKTLHM